VEEFPAGRDIANQAADPAENQRAHLQIPFRIGFPDAADSTNVKFFSILDIGGGS